VGFEGFHDRLRQAAGGRSNRQLADVTGLPIASIRRIVDGGEPTTEIVEALCIRMDLSADWLLLGRGPVHASDVRREALRQVPAADLIGSLAVAVRRRLERAAQPAAGRAP
jgi:hypothetical protein